MILAGAQTDPESKDTRYTTLKVLKVISSRGEEKRAYYSEGMDAIGNFTQVKYVNLNQRTQGYLAATADQAGSLAVFSNGGYDKVVEHISAHQGPITHLAISPDNKTVFSTGEDGSIFIFEVTEQALNPKDGSTKPITVQEDTGEKKVRDPRLKFMDPELAEIVLVKRDEMEEWQ